MSAFVEAYGAGLTARMPAEAGDPGNVIADVVFELRWARSGFQRITFSDPRVVATFAFTTAPASVVGELRLPWEAFTIDFAPGDVPVGDTYLRRVAVTAQSFDAPDFLNVVSHLASGRDVLDMPQRLTTDPHEPTYPHLTGALPPAEDRCTLVVRRIVANVVLALTNEANFGRRMQRPGRKGSYARRMSKLPETPLYVIGRDLKLSLDLREELRAYIESGQGVRTLGPVSVQTLVAGHGKWQPHGPGSLKRKWITIQPYWRGPEDAPIVVRPHVLADIPTPALTQPGS